MTGSILRWLAGRHWIVALAAVKCFTEGLGGVGVPVKLDVLGWDEWGLGARAAAGAGTYAVASGLLSLFLTRRVRAAPLMALGCVVDSASALGLALTGTPWLIYAFTAGHSLAAAIFWIPFMAWVGQGSDEHLVGDLAAFNVAWMGAHAVGSFVGGQAEAALAGLSLWLIAGVTAALAAATPFAHIRGQAHEPGVDGPSPDVVRLPRRYLEAAWTAAFLTALAITVPQAIFVKLHTALGHGPGDYGVFWAVMGGMRVAVVLLLAAYQGWRYRAWPMAGCLLLGAAGSALLAAGTGQGAFVAAAALLGLGAGAGYLLGYYYSVHGRAHRARNAGLFAATIVTQSILAGPLGGFLAAQFSRRAPYAFTAGLAALAAGAVALWLRSDRGSPAAPGEPEGGVDTAPDARLE